MRTSVGTGSIKPYGPTLRLTWQLSRVSNMIPLLRLMTPDIDCIKACLPTLRPVWVAVRRSLFGTQATNQSTDPSSWATPQKRVQASSWATKILKSSSYDNEDTQPFSALDSHTEEGPHRYSALGQSQAKTAVAIPLPTLNKGHPDGEGITVKRAWDVEYNQ